MYFVGDIKQLSKANNEFRKVLYTADRIQLVLMSLKPGQSIGHEVHPNTDQFIRIEYGRGLSIIDDTEYELKSGGAVIIPAGTWHNIINTGTVPLKLYTIYSPPEHDPEH